MLPSVLRDFHPQSSQASLGAPPSGAACRIADQTNGSMPLLTELAETVVGCGSYKHAAPTELVVSRRHRCYKLSVISVISCSNPSQQFCTESETPWTGRSETCPTSGSSVGHISCSCSYSCSCSGAARSRRLRGPAGRRPALRPCQEKCGLATPA